MMVKYVMNDPIAYFLTISTYGTWLPGDERGWVEYKQGWKLPDPILELESKSRMSEDACILTSNERNQVEEQLAQTCRYRNWHLHAKNCRSNHLHVAVSAYDVSPKKVRIDLKAWCTRRLKERCNSTREQWWAERGSIRWVLNEESLERVVMYVNETQDRKGRDLI